MKVEKLSRRGFFGTSAGAVLADPGRAAARSVGVKAGDLPDLTIKEVKVYVLGREQIAAIVTNSGIEGNYTLGGRYWHPNWSNAGWLEYAKGLLRNKSVLDLPALTSQYEPGRRRVGQSSYAAAIDNCLWDIMGKAVGLPVFRILGAYRDKVLAYASSQHHANVEDFVEEVKRVKALGLQGLQDSPAGSADARAGAWTTSST